MENSPENQTRPPKKWPLLNLITISELKAQRGIALPLALMNLLWFMKFSITTIFLGRIGDLELAGGALGFTFANITGISVLNGISSAMEPICGQAFGAKNYKLMHKTLIMTILLNALVSAAFIAVLWLKVDDIMVGLFGQREEIADVAKTFLFYLLPDLAVYSVFCPVRAYLSSQGKTVVIMFGSVLALGVHVPLNFFIAGKKGLAGVSTAVWISDLSAVVLLVGYLWFDENRSQRGDEQGGWFEQGLEDWVRLIKLAVPCCLTTCLEWWCYEILVLLTGRLKHARQSVEIISVVLNFDFLLYAFMLGLATSASVRVSNELGAGLAGPARSSSRASLALGSIAGLLGGLVMVSGRGIWGSLFSRDKEVVRGIEKMMLIMALIEVVNFPLSVCSGIVRGTARPSLSLWAFVGGFYFLALPLSVALAFKAGFGLGGLLIGFLIGMSVCLVLLLVFVFRINWDEEAVKALRLASVSEVSPDSDESEAVDNDSQEPKQNVNIP